MGRDDLFDDDPLEEKDSGKGAEEEFFFDIGDDDLEADKPPEDEMEPFAVDDGGADEEETPSPVVVKSAGGGSSRRILLLILLLIVLVGAGYFFMGDMLMPPAPEPVATVKQAQPQKIKVPERPQPGVKQEVLPAEEVSGVQETTQPTAEDLTATEAKPETAPPAVAEKEQAAAQPVTTEAQPKEATVAPPEESPATTGDAAQAVDAQQPAQATEIASEETAAAVPQVAEETPEPSAEPEPPAGPYYVLQVGAFLVDANLETTLKAVTSLGYEPEVIDRLKTTTMTRLRVGSYEEPVAREKLKELQQLNPDAFLLWDGSRYVLYAGSYYNLDRARSQADKLYQHEIKIDEEPVELAVPMKIVRFGHFADTTEAEQAAQKAKQEGLETLVVKRN